MVSSTSIWICFVFHLFFFRVSIIDLLRQVVLLIVIFFVSFHIDNSDDKVRSTESLDEIMFVSML